MGCARYGPLLSRYLDDDLQGVELEGLLAHLAVCPGCRKEHKDLEKLQTWLKVADAFETVPDVLEQGGLSDFIKKWEARIEETPGREGESGTRRFFPESVRTRDRRPGMSSWLGAFFSPLFSRNSWRFAFPMMALVILGLWLYPGDLGNNRIDVQDLSPTQLLTTKLPQKELHNDNMDLYIIEHTTQQPWEDFGYHLPMVQQVSGAAR